MTIIVTINIAMIQRTMMIRLMVVMMIAVITVVGVVVTIIMLMRGQLNWMMKTWVMR